MDKWKKAVVHLECATDSEHYYDRIKRSESLTKDLNEGKITLQQFAEATSGGSRDLRYFGTAIFLLHNEKYYLTTARHGVRTAQNSNRILGEIRRLRKIYIPNSIRQHYKS